MEPEASPSLANGDAGSVIRGGSLFQGDYRGAGDLTVEGEVRGSIDCKGQLVVQEGATVDATVTAAKVLVAGHLTGDITCSERFEAAPTGRVNGHISTPRVIIQEGARCDGQITMTT